ncbi:DNA lyase [Dehalococcoidia bacterium]|nr:DNA lyase [Dehalococcoidia bacterium]
MKTECDDWVMKQYEKSKPELKRQLADFEKFGQEANRDDLFAELAYCLCTPQNPFRNCRAACHELTQNKLMFSADADLIAYFLHKSKVRFHNNKAAFIVEARAELYDDGRQYDIKTLVQQLRSMPQLKARDYLLCDVYIKGLGPKESSHFLRNIGHGDNLAILDRHILLKLVECDVIETHPTKNPTYREYIDIESRMREWSRQLGISLGELDLLLWTGGHRRF